MYKNFCIYDTNCVSWHFYIPVKLIMLLLNIFFLLFLLLHFSQEAFIHGRTRLQLCSPWRCCICDANGVFGHFHVSAKPLCLIAIQWFPRCTFLDSHSLTVKKLNTISEQAPQALTHWGTFNTSHWLCPLVRKVNLPFVLFFFNHSDNDAGLITPWQQQKMHNWQLWLRAKTPWVPPLSFTAPQETLNFSKIACGIFFSLQRTYVGFRMLRVMRLAVCFVSWVILIIDCITHLWFPSRGGA